MKKITLTGLILLTALMFVLPGLAWGEDIGQNITTITEDVEIQKGERILGNVTTVSGNITVFGEVTGNVTSATGSIYLRDSSVIRGNVTTATGKILRDPGANVKGTVFRGTKMPQLNLGMVPNPGITVVSYPTHVFNRFTNMLGILAVVVILISILPLNGQKMLGALKMEPGRVILVGTLGWVLLPFLIIISLITIIGPVLLIVGALAAFLLGTGILGLLLGEKLVALFKWQFNNKIVAVSVGLAAMWLVSLLPIASVFIFFASAIVGMGVVLVTKFGTNRPWFPPRQTRDDFGMVDLITKDYDKGEAEDEKK